jgi:iron(III) transport system substrate-binding protein
MDGATDPAARALSRRTFLQRVGLGGAATLLVACQQPSPGTGPAAPAAPAAPAPAAPRRAAVTADWERAWNALVEAAREEGRVVVSGPPTPETRTQLAAAFTSRFGVEVEYFAPGSTSVLVTRLVAERAAGQYTVDVILGGAAGLYTHAHPDKMLAPLAPALVHPEAADPSRWVGGRVWFMDPEQQYILRLSQYLTNEVAVNTQYQRAEEIKTWRDLLDPRYRGKIATGDPGVPGGGSNTAAYLLKTLGEDYVRALYQGQQPGISREMRQIADWLARGTYPIALDLSARDIEPLKADGFPIAVVLRDDPEVPPALAVGFGLGALVDPAPHPSAAKLFLNWIAMPEGQEVWNRTQGSVSVRTDVSSPWAPEYSVPKPGVDYFDSVTWDWTFESRSPAQLEKLKVLTGRT